uniref:Sodium/potassium-transporting ATPase subunit beta n=1 Tax=Cuerna arida TaxID=1464854 RepID=A0A1B6FQY1_9HEMI
MSIAGTQVKQGVYEFPLSDRRRDMTAWQSAKRFFYNPDTKEVMERPLKLWGYSLVFYLLFYSVLAAMFAICMRMLYWRLEGKAPVYVLEESLIGVNPGLGFRPMSYDVDEGSLIWYEAKNESSVAHWVKAIDEFLLDYEPNQNKSIVLNRKPCSYDTIIPEGQVCDVKLSDFKNCTRENNYGYANSSPCIFIKLNRIFSWVPDFYTSEDVLPKEMPEQLKALIKSPSNNGTKNIWISCEGEYEFDKEHIRTDFAYYPIQGFPSYYYPFVNSPGYLSPLVAVQINRPSTNVLINIECRAWAKNIHYHGGKDREGSIRFELLID